MVLCEVEVLRTDRSAVAESICGCASCIPATVQTDGFDRCPRFLQAHSIANSIINPRLSDNLYFELSARICTSQVFIQPNPIGFQQEFAVPDGLSVPANLRLVIVPLIIHPMPHFLCEDIYLINLYRLVDALFFEVCCCIAVCLKFRTMLMHKRSEISRI